MSPVENIGDGLLLPTKGLITVDLIDADTGRVIQREESENFLSLQSIKVAKWWQRMMWGAYNPVETSDAAGNKPTEMPWFPAEHLGYWNDATAESAGTEDRVNADLIGWASRHPVGSPTGKRGVVNISESAFSDTSAKWVFDWSTSQGNGVFQSVGWTRVDEVSGFLIARFPEDDGINFTNLGNSGSNGGNPLWWDATGSVWNLSEYLSATNQCRVVSAAATGGATTPIVSLPTAAWNGSSILFGLARIGTDIITCGRDSSVVGRLMRHTTAGVQTWLRVEPTLSITYNDCTVDGASAIWTAGSDGALRRHSNADGTIAATITLALAPTALEGVAYDSTDSNFWVIGTVAGVTKQMWKVDASGNTIAPLYSLRQNPATVTSTAPFAGSYTVPRSAARDTYVLTEWTNTSLPGSDIARTPTRAANTWASTAANLATKSGEPWIANRSGAGSEVGGTGRASAVRGGTLGTRSKLGSAITKTSAQTLKVTYTFNFS